MGAKDLKEYLDDVKVERNSFFKSSFERAYISFIELGFDKKEANFFVNNASMVVEKMREQCWTDFLEEEREFTIFMMKKLIDKEYVEEMASDKAIEWYVETYPEHIYQLNLSNTQSRRSRAGKEFEDIIELILIGAGVPMDSQGNIGKESFVQKGLGKMVDAVSPGVVEFEENKRNTVLISAKTTLRERWQEVPEEMGRTGAREMFLATLDDKISEDVLNTLYEANIQVTTTKAIKESRYPNNSRVLSFEQLIQICLDNCKHWEGYSYSVEQIEQVLELLERQVKKHENHEYVKKAFENRMMAYTEKLCELKSK
ncbi:MAG: hypothetical protein IKL06_06260 [Lachnospiraceae bacterium]|nr:hypothetical protein [Lachnospiraceae bacterium]